MHFLTHLAAERRVAASTQSQALNAILFFFRFVLDKDLGDISDVVRAPKRRRLHVVLTLSETAELIDGLSGVNQLMARLIYGAGLRRAECLKLRIKDIDFERSRVSIRFGKGGIVRRHHVHSTNLQRQIKKAALHTGLAKRVTVHTLRHSFATHLLENGYDIRTIQELSGHSSVRTTMVYTHMAGKNLMGVKSPLDE